MKKKYKQLRLGRFVAIGFVLVAGLGASVSYAAGSGNVGDFTRWAGNLVKYIEQLKYFISIVATIGGMWFIFAGLGHLKNHHTPTKGQQGDHVRNGIGQLVVGTLLIAIVPMTQMIGSTVTKGAGDPNAYNTFEIKEKIPDAN
ncbi:hypothetical protein [Facilibium subflavum]|uniref:hypothetical protein n=1 Tax=Facilibium subflavum TaxID=2219058 RepID=UPI000E65641C|nr:hypothetical protein [Facilibium subflavum]